MSLSVRATLFYGYLQPAWDREIYLHHTDPELETPWTDMFTKRIARCVGGCMAMMSILAFI